MEHNVILQAYDEQQNLHTWQYYDIKSYLINENHVHDADNYKFHKAIIFGHELTNEPNGSIGVNYFRNIFDFKIFCRRKIGYKSISSPVPNEILRKFLLEETEYKRESIFQAIKNGAQNLNKWYSNGGGGHCEYRPGYIEGYSFFNSKGVKISWVNDEADLCNGIVTKSQIFNEIKELIKQGMYYIIKDEIKPKIAFYEDKKQLQGQMSIMDFIGG